MSQNLLQEALNNSNYNEPEFVDGHLATAFKEMLGVDVKQEGDFFLFKYHMLAARWELPVVHHCRGTIMYFDRAAKHWSYASRPFDKFFNLHEEKCELYADAAFDAALRNSSMAVEKVDGSLIQLWFDHTVSQWRVSTSGSITSKTIHQSGITFEDLFWRHHPLLAHIGCAHTREGLQRKHPGLNTNTTYMFELATPENAVVSDYGRSRLVYLNSRRNATGEYIPGNRGGVFELPRTFRVFLDLNISTKKELQAWAEAECAANRDVYGHIPEGFVLYDGVSGRPLAKMKMPEYVKAHTLNDPLRWEKSSVEAIFSGCYDDICGSLSDGRRERADKHLAKILDVMSDVLLLARQPATQKAASSDRKTYALRVQKGVPKIHQSFFFQNQESVAVCSNLHAKLCEWMTANSTRLTKWYLAMYSAE